MVHVSLSPRLGFFFLFFILTTTYAFAQDYGSGDDDWGSSPPAGDDDSGGDGDFGGSEVATPEDIERYDPAITPGQYLKMDLRLYCHMPERSAEEAQGGMMFVARQSAEKEGYVFVEDYFENGGRPQEPAGVIDQGNTGLSSTGVEGLLLPFVFEDKWWFYRCDDFTYGYYDALLCENVKDAMSFATIDTSAQTYAWKNAPTLSLDTNPTDVIDRAKMHRFEGQEDETYAWWEYGGCIPMLQTTHFFNYTSSDQWTRYSYNRYANGGAGDVSRDTVYINPYPEYGFDIVWDESKDACGAIGGAWLDNSEFSVSSGGYQCCGDDTMWLRNRALYANGDDYYINTEIVNQVGDDGFSTNEYCLYGSSDTGSSELDYDKISTDEYSYLCPATGYQAYDLTRYLDDDYDEDDLDGTGLVHRYDPYYFSGSGDSEYDLGKWSDRENQNPYFCSYSFENDGDFYEKYQWLDVNAAGDQFTDEFGNALDVSERSSSICEKFLGGKWIGGHCCGNKYDYDSQKYLDESFNDPLGLDRVTNPACLQGTALANKTVGQYVVSEAEKYPLLNSGGALYSCGLGTDGILALGNDYYTDVSLVPEAQRKNYCAVLADHVCTYNETTWRSVSSDAFVKTDLKYTTSATGPLASTAPWAASLGYQQTECCFADSCWNGTTCAPEGTEVAWTLDGTNDDHYICMNSDWQSTTPKYDWYVNVEAEPTYCLYDYSCVCSTNPDDATYCGTSDTSVITTNGCTASSNFVSSDHYCEDLSGSSVWTSRTKFIAAQLYALAEQNSFTEYTIYCDTYTNALTNYVAVDSIPDSVNSFCILDYNNNNQWRVVGVSINPEDPTDLMTFDPDAILFEGSNGLLDDVLDDSFEDCDTAYTSQNTYPQGAYYSCEGDSTSNAWFNMKMKSLLYAKNSGTIPSTLSLADPSAFTTFLTLYLGGSASSVLGEHVIDHANSIDDAIVSSQPFLRFSDFNKLYIHKQGTVLVVGAQETRYDEEIDANRDFLAVLYQGIDVSCDQVEEAYTDDVYCSDDEGYTLVLERTISGSSYWQDLTSKLRIPDTLS